MDSLAHLKHRKSNCYVSSLGDGSMQQRDFVNHSFKGYLSRRTNDKYVLKVTKSSMRELSDSNLLLSCKPYIERYYILTKTLGNLREVKISKFLAVSAL